MPYTQAYREANHDIIKERERAAGKRWRDKNKEKCAKKDKAWREANPKRNLAYEQARYSKFRAYVNKVKDVPCKDCGSRFPACCMDLHHRDPSEKEFTIGACSSRRREVLDAEIAKCDVLCAN